jgi:hypothetical protein
MLQVKVPYCVCQTVNFCEDCNYQKHSNSDCRDNRIHPLNSLVCYTYVDNGYIPVYCGPTLDEIDDSIYHTDDNSLYRT